MHACIPEGLAKIVGVKTLTIGYTKDIKLAEKIARATGARELLVETRPEGETLMLNEKEQAKWRHRGWRLEGRTAKKTLVANILEDHSGGGTEGKRQSEVQGGHTSEGYSEGGRLMASMLFETASEVSSGLKDDSSTGQDDDSADDERYEQSEQMDIDTNA